VGSRSKIDLAYIAGFLDGDGSLMMQIKKRTDTKSGFRFMLTICFYQDKHHSQPLYWIRKILKIGYISNRQDKISELRINGFKQVEEILKILLPFLKFKKEQAKIILQASLILKSKKAGKLSKKELKKLSSLMFLVQKHNYKSNQRKNKKDIYKILGLTP